MGWLIALGVLTLIAILPIGVSAYYDEDGPRVLLIAGPASVPLFPAKEKKEIDKKKKQTKKVKTTCKPVAKTEKKKKGGSLYDFLPVVDTVLDFLAAFGRKLRVNNLQLKVILANSDPCDLALNYGKAWTALGNLMPLLEKAFVIKKRNLEVECDFLADSTTIMAHLDISITIARILSLLVVNGTPVLKEIIRLMKLRKGGAKA